MGCSVSIPEVTVTMSPASPAKVVPTPGQSATPASPAKAVAGILPTPAQAGATALVSPAKGVNPNILVGGAGHPSVVSGAHHETMAASAKAGQTIIFVLGAPGAGKGTQCEKIAKMFGFFQISTGDLLRDEVASGSELGTKLSAIMAEGALVSTDLVLGMVKKAMAGSGTNKFLLDGYPRAQDQAVEFEAAIGKPAFVLAFDADENTLEERLVKRGLTSGRADDNRESIKKRFATFKSQSEAVIEYYKTQNLVRAVNSLRHPNEVFDEVGLLFDPNYVATYGAFNLLALTCPTPESLSPLSP